MVEGMVLACACTLTGFGGAFGGKVCRGILPLGAEGPLMLKFKDRRKSFVSAPPLNSQEWSWVPLAYLFANEITYLGG